MCEELFALGVAHIPHYSAKPGPVYSEILKGRNAQPLLALEGDLAGGAVRARGGRAGAGRAAGAGVVAVAEPEAPPHADCI